MLSIRAELDEKSNLLSEYSVEYIQEAIKNRGKSELKTLAKAKAQHIDQELMEIGLDAQYLADGMNIALSSPPAQRNLKVANYEQIYTGEPYIFYTSEILRRGIDANLADEVARASTIVDLLVPFGRRYINSTISFLAASKNGYFICVETTPEGNTIDFAEEFLSGYDARTRPWYKKGETATKSVFTDVYTDTGGIPAISCVAPYYDGSGDFAGVISIAYRTKNIYKIVLETAIGEDGFSFILNSSGNVVISAKNEGIFSVKEENYDLREKAEPDLAEAAKKMAAGETGIVSVVIDGSEHYLAFAPMSETDWSFATLLNRDTLLAPALSAHANLAKQMDDFRNSIGQLFFRILIGSVLLLGGLSVWMFVGSSRVSKKFVKPIQQLSDGVKEISGGNFNKKLEITTGDEIEQLADSFNAMTDNLKTYMANLEKVTAAVMTLANQQLCQGNDEMMFITVFVAMLDLKTGKLIYLNGGHNPPMLYRDAEKKFHYMDVEQNCVLGLMDEMDFEQQETQMNHGDIIYLYTDGVTEAMNKNREQYGEERLENCLNATDHQCNLQTLLESVKESLAQHVQDAEQSDDITMLSVRLK